MQDNMREVHIILQGVKGIFPLQAVCGISSGYPQTLLAEIWTASPGAFVFRAFRCRSDFMPGSLVLEEQAINDIP